MFRILSIFIILGSLFWLFYFLKKNKFSLSKVIYNYFSLIIQSFSNLKFFKSQNIEANLNLIKKIVYLSTLSIFLLMAISAFIPLILFGGNLSGVFLLIHVSLAPIFSILLAVLIILFAHSQMFIKSDFVLPTFNENTKEIFRINKSGYLKIVFWLIGLFSIPAMISIILSMFPIFGTEGQIYLLDFHRYSTIILFVLVVFHIGLVTVESK